MNCKIRNVIPLDAQATKRVVQRERKIGERSSCDWHWRLAARDQNGAQRPEIPNRAVRLDCRIVVEDKRSVEAVPVGRGSREDQGERDDTDVPTPHPLRAGRAATPVGCDCLRTFAGLPVESILQGTFEEEE